MKKVNGFIFENRILRGLPYLYISKHVRIKLLQQTKRKTKSLHYCVSFQKRIIQRRNQSFSYYKRTFFVFQLRRLSFVVFHLHSGAITIVYFQVYILVPDVLHKFIYLCFKTYSILFTRAHTLSNQCQCHVCVCVSLYDITRW